MTLYARSVSFVTGEVPPAPTTLAGRGALNRSIVSIDVDRNAIVGELDLNTIARYFESIEDAVLICSDFGQVLFAGGATQALFGALPAAIVGTQAPLDVTNAMRDGETMLTNVSDATSGLRVASVRAQDTIWLGRHANLLVIRETTSARRNEELVRRNEERFRSLMSSAPVGIFQLAPTGLLLYANPRLTELVGAWQPGQTLRSLISPDDRERLDDLITHTLRYSDNDGVTVKSTGLDGTPKWIRIRMGMLFGVDGTVRGLVGSVADVSSSVDAQQTRDRLIAILEATSDIVAICEPDGTLSYLNHSARVFLGTFDTKDFLVGQKITDLYPSWARTRWKNSVLPIAASKGSWSGDLAMLRGDGTEVSVSQVTVAHFVDGQLSYLSTIARDVTEPRELARRLQHQALHDPLTGLPNRTLLIDRLQASLTRLNRRRSHVALVFGDLDRFKLINDSLGHTVGDQLLLEVTARVRNALRPGDTVARFGGDEFVVLCEDVADTNEAIEIARRLVRIVSEPYSVAGAEIYVTTSFGVAVTNRADCDPHHLLRDADVAMYHAKQNGKNCYQLFDNSMRERLLTRAADERDLHRALDRNELFVEYQPEIRLTDGAMVGVEALARWQHPTDGIVYPGRFIELAEETGLIGELGFQILAKACADARTLQSLRKPSVDLREPDRYGFALDARIDHNPNVRVAVNLSGRQLALPDIADQIRSIIKATGVDPSWLALEVTESVLMEDVDHTIGVLRDIRSLDIRIGIDDFGTGYSSLAHLRAFPVDFLKIDRSFVKGIGIEDDDTAIVATIVNLAHNLGMAAIAEGVETQAQLDALARLGCDLAQGYGIAKPVTLDRLVAPPKSMRLV